MRHRTAPFLILLTIAAHVPGCPVALADGAADNVTEQVRPIPPVGIEVGAANIGSLATRCEAIRAEWKSLGGDPKPPHIKSLASEVLVFPRAVEMAIEFGQFYQPSELDSATKLLDEASRRIKVIAEGGDWAKVVGLDNGTTQQLIVGGYPSKIDGSFQPYGMVIPAGMIPCNARPRRLDIWFHGRNEKLSEVAFLSERQRVAGEYTPADTFVLHPYGRYCNAFKFAGEIDVLEALDYVSERLPVDPNRISVRGFSMGGAACWQFATHYADRWFAANPGAGFSETPNFLHALQGEDVRKSTADYKKTLWQLYDCPVWATNLMHCPTIAYSGEFDRQKQAADEMSKALQDVGIDLIHIIGQQTAHQIHPESKVEIEARMNRLADLAVTKVPRQIDFTTVSLRYHRMHWIDVQGLQEHWKPATVKAAVNAASRIHVNTENVSRLRFDFQSGQWPGAAAGPLKIEIDDTTLIGPRICSDHSWTWELERDNGKWVEANQNDPNLRKRPGLQGPIDDAFMSSFVFVLPSGKSSDVNVQEWIDTESAHAMLHWRKHFRGDIARTTDRELTQEQIASSNLILFGDAESNSVINQIAADLPVHWTENEIKIGDHEVPRNGHVPVMIYPNPLNPDRYVVINSGFTFREYDYLNNARQTPTLPDWALVDIRGGATTQMPGVVVAGDFFDENWQP